MKLGGTQNQEIKSIFASKTEVVKTASNNSSEAARSNENTAGSASKLGEFINQAARAKQQFLAKAFGGSSTAAQTSGLGTEATVTKVGNQVIIDAGAGDDKIGVTQDAAGNVTVEVNGKTQTFAGKDKDNLVIKAGNPFYDEANKKNGSGQDGVVKYEIASVYRAASERPPVVGLFHELGHTYDFTNGTGRKGVYDGKDKVDKIDTPKEPINKKPDVVNLERVATGLAVDHDNDAKTPEIRDPNHPQDLTENGFRDELALPKREHYREN